MARLVSPYPIVGTLGNVSMYKNRLTDKVVVRMKGGPSKSKIKTAKSCKGIRMQNKEFEGCGMANKAFFVAIYNIKHLNDYVVAGDVTKIIKAIQGMDTVHQKGERNIDFSANHRFLEGFHLNKKNPFGSVFTNSIPSTINRLEGKVTVQIPEVMPGINFLNPWPYSSFRFIVNIGAVYDTVFKRSDNLYEIQHESGSSGVNFVCTDWMPTNNKIAAQALEVGLKGSASTLIDEHTTIIVSIGIEFGTNKYGETKPVKHVGCSMVLSVG